MIEICQNHESPAIRLACATDGTQLLVPVVQTLDSVIHRINHYLVDTYQGNQLRYLLDRDLSSGQLIHLLNNWGLVKSVCEPSPKSFFLTLALNTRYDWTVKKAIAHLLIRLKGNSERISLYSLSPLDAQDMDLWLLRRRSCPFRKRSLPFLRHLEKFDCY